MITFTGALIYQKILLESEITEKLKLLKLLKDSFKNEDIEEAFDIELKRFLEMKPSQEKKSIRKK